MPTRPRPTSTYSALFAIRGMRPLAAAMLLTRLGGAMWNLTLILFVLQRFHSPVLAGLTTFFAWVPGLLISPLTGALLDRYRPALLVSLDMGIAVATNAAIVLLSLAGELTPAALFVVVALSSLTGPLTGSGIRSLLPVVVPKELWERGNAVDVVSDSGAMIAGPALAGVLFATLGGLGTLVAISVVWVLAGLLIILVKGAPAHGAQRRQVLRETLEGILYVARKPVLRALGLLIPLVNAAVGIFYVALPVLFRQYPHGGSAVVGGLWSLFGAAALGGGIVAGRMATEGRERRIMMITLAVGGLGQCLIAASPLIGMPLLAAAAGMLVGGVADGPHYVAMFSLRLRAIEPAWMGRAMSMSMAIHALGVPIGSALAGPAVALSLPGAMGLGASLTLLAAILCPFLLPRQAGPPAQASS